MTTTRATVHARTVALVSTFPDDVRVRVHPCITLAHDDAEGSGEAAWWPGRASCPSMDEMHAAARIVAAQPLHDDALAHAPHALSTCHPGAAWAAFVAYARLVSSRHGRGLRVRPDDDEGVLSVEVAALARHDELAVPPDAPMPAPWRRARVRKQKLTQLDEDTLQALRAHALLRPPATLRLDANEGLSSWDDVHRLVHAAGPALAFIEQPLPTSLLRARPDRARAPIALDEALLSVHDRADEERLLDDTQPVALVLKPAALGPARTLAWADAAAQRGLDVVVSALFDSAAGLRDLAAVHAALQPRDRAPVAAGLGTARFLASLPPSSSRGWLHARDGALWMSTAAVDVDESRATRERVA